MLITNKKQLCKYYTDQRIWQGIPSIEVTPKGRVFVTWYSGTTKEGDNNYCLGALIPVFGLILWVGSGGPGPLPRIMPFGPVSATIPMQKICAGASLSRSAMIL